jgi:hypothetical protein
LRATHAREACDRSFYGDNIFVHILLLGLGERIILPVCSAVVKADEILKVTFVPIETIAAQG